MIVSLAWGEKSETVSRLLYLLDSASLNPADEYSAPVVLPLFCGRNYGSALAQDN
jgi:hypothetical protein